MNLLDWVVRFVEWMNGWRYVGNIPQKNKIGVHPNIIKKLQRRIYKKNSKKIKKWKKKISKRIGWSCVPSYPEFTTIAEAKGKKYLYRGEQTISYIDNHGHGGWCSSGIAIYKKHRCEDETKC